MVKLLRRLSVPSEPDPVPKVIQKRPKKKVKILTEDTIDELLCSSNEDTMTPEEYYRTVHEFFRAQNKKNPGTSNRMKEYLCEKACEVCRDVRDEHLLLLCDYCDDGYHTYCLEPKIEGIPEDVWCCPECLRERKEKRLMGEEIDETTQKLAETPMGKTSKGNNPSTSTKKNQRQTTLHEHYERIKVEPELEKDCGKCQASITDEREFCTRCHGYFHRACFPKKKNAILCKECVDLIKASLPPKNSTILNYFSSKSQFPATLTDPLPKPQPRSKSRSKKRTVLSLKRKKTFKLPRTPCDPSQEIELKHSLLFALKAKGIEFDDDLRYSNPKCPPVMNNGDLEVSLQKMDKETLRVFHEFKQMTRQGNYAPVIIEPDKTQGFFVRAAEDIPEMTLISEYVGDVDFARNRIFDQNDSIMDLLRTTRSKTSLVICPEKYGNLARFLSGINNTEKDAKKRQNVQSVRFNVEGQARVILFAKRSIKKGEVLCYDYNEGCFDEYPTQNFV